MARKPQAHSGRPSLLWSSIPGPLLHLPTETSWPGDPPAPLWELPQCPPRALSPGTWRVCLATGLHTWVAVLSVPIKDRPQGQASLPVKSHLPTAAFQS